MRLALVLQMQNRLLRLVQRPLGVYHCSVFYQFSGCLGPSGMARDPQVPLPLPLALPLALTLSLTLTSG